MGNPISRTLLGGALLLGLAAGCGSPRGNGPGPDEDSGAAPGDAPIGADDRGGTGVDVPLFPDDRGGAGIDVPPFPDDRGAVPDAGGLPDLQGPTFDIPAPEDRGAVDVPRVDRPDVPAPADAGAGAFACGTLTGTPIPRAAGGVARVVGDTTAAWMAQNPGGVATSNSPIRPPSSNTACLPSRGQVVYSYTVGATPAGLTISTTNPGTQRNFDTVLWVTSRCATALTTAACNDDDDAFASSADRRVSSSVTTDVLPAGATVFVVVGGYYPNSGDGTTVDRGPFELTIQEFSPAGAGGSCRVDGRGQRCDTSVVPALACVGGDPGAETGTCRVRGSLAGSPCRASAPECDAGLTCSPNGLCQSVVATGGACDAFRACEAGSACVSSSFGATRGTCVRAGSALAAPCRPVGATGGRCDSFLVCSADYNPADANPTCVQLAPSGGACALLRTICPAGQSCVTVHGGLVGTCRADGTAATAACRASGTACDGGLVCRAPGEGAATRCVGVAAVGGRCDEATDCPDGSGCFLTDLSDRFSGRCGAVGSLGGSCSGSGTGCTSPTSCSAAGGAAAGICQNERAVGASCARPTDRCAAGATCVLNAGSFTAGTCRATGSVAGTECRTGDMPCGAGLACSGTALSQGVCQATAASGGACDPLGATIRCPAGQVCQATSSTNGTCQSVGSTEVEPNDTAAAVFRSPVAGATTRRGSLPFGDVDCVAVTVPANGSITALVGDGNGRCPVSPGGMTLDLYSTDGYAVRGSSSNSAFGRCAIIDGTRAGVFPYASGLPGGTYFVCVRGFRDPTSGALTGPIADYVLSVSTSP